MSITSLIRKITAAYEKDSNLDYGGMAYRGDKNNPYKMINHVNHSLLEYFLRLRMYSASVDVIQIAEKADAIRNKYISPLERSEV
jgi:hypothetical protein